MRYLVLQLHITGACNLRCKHCYIDERCNHLPYDEILRILDQFDDLIGTLAEESRDHVKADLRITGGEPFLHPQIDEIMDLLMLRKDQYRLSFMSNGTCLNHRLLSRLQALELSTFQVSLDGNQETHDDLRGVGNYDEVLRALDLLYTYHIPARVSFTANKRNYLQFPEVAGACRAHHADSLWSDRYIPISDQSSLPPISKNEMACYIQILRQEHENVENAEAGLRVQNYRALQFLGSTSLPYSCKAGENLIVVDERGNIMPCRRMPIVCGNTRHQTLTEVYHNSSVFRSLRAHKLSGECQSCTHAQTCKGGLRCMSYAMFSDYTYPDPCCFCASHPMPNAKNL